VCECFAARAGCLSRSDNELTRERGLFILVLDYMLKLILSVLGAYTQGKHSPGEKNFFCPSILEHRKTSFSRNIKLPLIYFIFQLKIKYVGNVLHSSSRWK